MLVDDEPTSLDVIEMFLLPEGYGRFIKCTDARQVIPRLLQEVPDALLLNLRMPHVDGLEILSQMQADGRLRAIPVVIMTSSIDAETKQSALEHGATEFLHKPIDPSELVLRVRNTLAAKEFRDGHGEPSPQPPVLDKTAQSSAEAGRGRLISTLDARGGRSRAIIASFVARLHDKLQSMEASFESKDFAELLSLAHWLKGAAGTVGFDAFTEPAEELGELAANQKEEEIEEAIGRLSELAARIVVSGERDG
jgi:CheY-like chemotaxis protein